MVTNMEKPPWNESNRESKGLVFVFAHAFDALDRPSRVVGHLGHPNGEWKICPARPVVVLFGLGMEQVRTKTAGFSF